MGGTLQEKEHTGIIDYLSLDNLCWNSVYGEIMAQSAQQFIHVANYMASNKNSAVCTESCN